MSRLDYYAMIFLFSKVYLPVLAVLLQIATNKCDKVIRCIASHLLSRHPDARLSNQVTQVPRSGHLHLWDKMFLFLLCVCLCLSLSLAQDAPVTAVCVCHFAPSWSKSKSQVVVEHFLKWDSHFPGN